MSDNLYTAVEGYLNDLEKEQKKKENNKSTFQIQIGGGVEQTGTKSAIKRSGKRGGQLRNQGPRLGGSDLASALSSANHAEQKQKQLLGTFLSGGSFSATSGV